MKKIIAILTISALLTGCASTKGPTTGTQQPENVTVVYVEVEGYLYPCAVYDGYKAGGLSCAWNMPKEK